VATALKKEAKLVPRLQKSAIPEVREAGYGALWAIGRLRVLPLLRQRIQAGGEPDVRVAAIAGFLGGGKLAIDEVGRICSLLSPLLVDKETRVAAAAANSAARICPGLRDQMLDTVETFIKRGRLDPGHVNAVRAVDGPAHRATAAQRQRMLKILALVADDARFSPETRGAALTKLFRVDRPMGRKLARQHLKSEDQVLRGSAERVLGLAPKGRPGSAR
jgi:hypothetical protein